MASYPEEKPIWNDVKKITSSTTTPSDITNLVGILHTTTDDLRITKIISLDISRDYVGKIGDEIVIKFLFPYGDYINLLYPKRHNLELTVITSRHSNTGKTDTTTDIASSERYKAVFIESSNINDSLKFANTIDKFTLNNREPAEVTLQLINRTLEPLRIKTTQGIFNDVSREDFIRAILGGETYKVKVDGKPGLDALDIYQLDNKEKIKQIILPHNLLITAIPSYLQEKHTGLYNAGVGNYFQRYNKKRTWFVYPLFDFTRIDNDTGKKALIYGSSSIRFSGMRTTYMEEADTVLIMTSGEQRYKDDGEASQMNDGVGFRQANADLMMSKPVKMHEDGPIGIKQSLNTEVSLKKREDNLNFAPVSSRAISNNNMAEYSRHLINNGARVDLVWNNSNHDLLYPGMPCKYIYSEGDNTKEIKGVILNAYTMISTGNRSGIKMTDTSYSSVTMLTLFVEKFYEPNAFKGNNFTGTAVTNAAPVYIASTPGNNTNSNTTNTNTSSNTSNNSSTPKVISSGTMTAEGRDVTSIFRAVFNRVMYYTLEGVPSDLPSIIDIGDGRFKATDQWGGVYYLPISTFLYHVPSYVPWDGSTSATSSTSTLTTPSTGTATTTITSNGTSRLKIYVPRASQGSKDINHNTFLATVPRSELTGLKSTDVIKGISANTQTVNITFTTGQGIALPANNFNQWIEWIEADVNSIQNYNG